MIRRGREVRIAIGAIALFSGAALVGHIVAGVSLVLGLGLAGVAAAGGLTYSWRTASDAGRAQIRHVLVVGSTSGVVATILYDVTRAVLSVVDPSPYNPYEAVRLFGVALAPGGSAIVQLGAGIAFHLLNGTAFGIAYASFFMRSRPPSVAFALLSGIGWGLFLETFQLALYPGWLHVQFYQEFATISAASHLVFGATLGAVTRFAAVRKETYGPRRR